MAAMLLAMASICLGATFAKGLFPLIGAAGTTALRLLIAAVILSILQRIWRLRLSWETALAGLVYGCALGGMNLLFYMSISRIPLGIAIAVEFLGPLTVAIASSRRRSDLAWVALAIAGLLLLLPFGGSRQGLDPWGIVCAASAGVFWGLYILAGKRAGGALGPQAAAVGMSVAAIIVTPFGIAGAGASLLQPSILAAGLVVAVLSSAIPYSLEMFALKRLPAKSFGILTSGEPAVGAMMGTFLLGETLPLVKWIGIAAIVVASLGTTLIGRERTAEPLATSAS
ncbi:inner membrane transporter RhtA [Faunimonas pinastri]|uniref:Inner membrane transporter RhtA n=1 Tax=Faunimonas pinastri TaxID=1855383 RepID=A0A1H9LJG3_9HYPH|nr:inner membrane transporter RhtA [Faunimonas pinastri]